MLELIGFSLSEYPTRVAEAEQRNSNEKDHMNRHIAPGVATTHYPGGNPFVEG